MSHTTNVQLTDEQLAMLDGHCDNEQQKIIDEAKRHLKDRSLHEDEHLARLISDVLYQTRRTGYVYGYMRSREGRFPTHGHARNSYHEDWRCPYCQQGFRDQSGKLTNLEVCDFGRSFYTIEACGYCTDAVTPILIDLLANVRAQVSDWLRGDRPQLYRVPYLHCDECGWEGPACSHNPSYEEGRGRCQECGARNNTWGECPVQFIDRYALAPSNMVCPVEGSIWIVKLAEGVTKEDIEAYEVRNET